MIKRILPVALVGAAFIFNTGCKNDGGFTKYKGIEYKIVKDAPGKTAVNGDIVEFNIIAKTDTTVLGDSHKQNQPAVARVQDIQGSGQWQAVFTKLSAGDSAIVKISCDTLLKNIPPTQQQLPPWLKKGKYITVYLNIVSVKSFDDFKKGMDEKAQAQIQTDDKILQDYFAKNNIKPTKTASGLYYTISKEGTGDNITAGENVTLNYTGRTLDGTIFDSNVDTTFKGTHHPSPFQFVPGRGGVIKGWDEGILLFKKGTKGTLYIPSPLAYGEQSPSPAIGPNSVLMFDIEVLDVKPASAKPMPGGMKAMQ